MSPGSRPVKLACLACRASKIRCDGQTPCSSCCAHRRECRYRPSRRGGARRGPTATKALAKRRGHRFASDANKSDNDQGPSVLSPSNHHLQANSTIPFNLSSPSGSIGLPSPLSGVTDAPDILGTVELPAWSIRAYTCDQDLINAYYIFIHPYFPLLPPPAVPQSEDKFVTLAIRPSYADASALPYWPASPLGLAVAAMLVLIPLLEDTHAADDEAIVLRRSYADLYARSALDSLENALEASSQAGPDNGPRSDLHPCVPRGIEPVLALSLLSMFECCQGGNIAKMRVRANQALTTAMDLSLHMENELPVGYSDAHRRCWWTTVFLVYQSSIMNSSSPVVTFDDLRITTPFPEFRGCREPWPLLVNAQVALFRSCCIGRQLLDEGSSVSGLAHSLANSIRDLDSYILELAAEADRFRCVTNYQGAEANASRNLWAISNALIHTSRLTLHRVRAFTDRPVFMNGYYDFLATNTMHSSSRPASDIRLSAGRTAEINTLFPYTEQESVRICLHSSLVVSRIFRRLPSPNPTYSDAVEVENTLPWPSRQRLGSPRSVPYMASCQLQSFYVLTMVLWRIRTALSSGNLSSYYHLFDRLSPNTEVQDAERLVEELIFGMEALGASIRADVVFEGVVNMAREVEKVYEVTVMN